MKNILITAGGTKEYIDDVRLITNISSGLLGATIGSQLAEIKDYQIFYVYAKGAHLPRMDKCVNVPVLVPVMTAMEAQEAIKRVMVEQDIDLVIHSMAVSDFSFDKKSGIKLKSNDQGAFIEYMRQTIISTPKIIKKIKEWKPKTILVGFKFEVDIDHAQLIDLAKKSIKDNGCDLVIANDKEEMVRNEEHVAYFVFSEEMIRDHGLKGKMAMGKPNIANKLKAFIEKVLK